MAPEPLALDALAFRPAVRADLAAIVRLLADDDIGAARESTDPLAPEYGRAFDTISADPDEVLVVACLGDQVVGCLQLTLLHHLSHRGATRAHIESVRVASALRGFHGTHEGMKLVLVEP